MMLPLVPQLGRNSRDAQLEQWSVEKSLFVANPTSHACFVAEEATASGLERLKVLSEDEKEWQGLTLVPADIWGRQIASFAWHQAKEGALVRSPLIWFFSPLSGITAAILSKRVKWRGRKGSWNTLFSKVGPEGPDLHSHINLRRKCFCEVESILTAWVLVFQECLLFR